MVCGWEFPREIPTLLEILQMIQKPPPPKAVLQDVVSALLKQAFGKRPNAEPIIPMFYIASCYRVLLGFL